MSSILPALRVLSVLLVPFVLGEVAGAQTDPAKPAPTPPAAASPADLPSRLLQPAPSSVKVTRNIEYARPGGDGAKPLLLDLMEPKKEPDAGAALPLILWIHGGGWQMGSKDLCPASPFAAEGFVVASINYRLTQTACWPAQIHDCKAAIRFLRAHAKEYHIDPDRVGVWGASAGGHLAALLDTTGGVAELEGDLGNPDQSSRVQAACDWFGPTDFTVVQPDSRGRGMVDKLLCGPVAEHPDNARAASPMTYITADDAPILIMHGRMDPLVPLSQSESFEAALKAAGVSAELKVLDKAGHGIGFGMKDIDTVREYFETRFAVKKPHPAPDHASAP